MVYPARPPGGKAIPFLRIGYANEAQVEHTVLEAADFVIDHSSQMTSCSSLMRCQDESCIVQSCNDIVQAREDHHIRIEVEHLPTIITLEQLPEEERA